MRRALDLAARGLGETSPNPSVGAVILDPAGQTVGAGRTAPVGGPHAEVVALAQAGERARGGTAVVSLEPCDHTGRTGPCTQALLAAGIARVVFGVGAPDRLPRAEPTRCGPRGSTSSRGYAGRTRPTCTGTG